MTIKIFENEHYASAMYILIIITIIAITFNMINITNKININQTIHETELTGYAVSNPGLINDTDISNSNIINNINVSESEKQKLHSEKTYAIYYFILISLITIFFIVLVIFILPKIKHLT